VVRVSLDESRQPAFALARPAAYDRVTLTDRQIDAIVSNNPQWICFGTLFFMPPGNLGLLRRLLEACPSARRFYDVNLRPGNWSEALVRELLPLADVVKLNEAERDAVRPALAAARGPVCVTLAERGCEFDGALAPGYPVPVADAVGAGDAFSAALMHGLSQGWPATRLADFANRVGALVASRHGGTPFWTLDEAMALTR